MATGVPNFVKRRQEITRWSSATNGGVRAHRLLWQLRDMAERHADRVRELLEQIDARLRDAERLRSHVEERRESPFWPDRRRIGRIPAPNSEDDSRRKAA